jgi:uncharacterized protein (TIGR01777 family)
MKKILVTGASGFIGGALVKMLIGMGNTVTAVSRSRRNSGQRQMTWITWEELDRAIPEQEVIVNLAGENVFGGLWTDSAKKRILESRVVQTRRIAALLKADPGSVKLFISASAVGFYGDCGVSVITERTKKGTGFLSDVCEAWESEANAAKDAVTVSIPRIGVVLEKGGGALATMMPQFEYFLGGPAGGDQIVPWIHRDDVLKAFDFVMNEPIPGAWNAVAPNPVSMETLAQELGKAMRRPSLFKAPAFVLKMILGEASTALLSSQRVQPERLLAAGFNFQYPEINEALRAITGSRI